MPIDEERLRAELPEFLELLGGVVGWVGALDLAKAREIPEEALADLSDGLLHALGFLHELFALRGEPPPFPEPGIAFGSLGPSLRRTLPQRLAAQLEDELNAVPGTRLEDVSQFTALGLFACVSDLLRLVGFLEEERSPSARRAGPPTVVSVRKTRPRVPAAAPAPPAPPPGPPPDGPGPDLSAYDIRIDETGERVDSPGASVWFAAAAGPRATGAGLAASFAVPFPGGVALAVADGADASLGARLGSVVAVRAFCRAAAASPGAPEAAVLTAQRHLDLLLSALLAAGDGTDALARIRGNLPPGNVRRILAHTRQPDEALRRVAPALATGLVGAVAVSSRRGLRASVVRLGPGVAEARLAGSVAPLFGGLSGGAAPLLAPGACGSRDVSRIDTAAAVDLSPGDALLLGTPALARGAPGGWAALATLWSQFPEGLAEADSGRDLLRRAERWGEAEPPQFGGALGFALLLAR